MLKEWMEMSKERRLKVGWAFLLFAFLPFSLSRSKIELRVQSDESCMHHYLHKFIQQSGESQIERSRFRHTVHVVVKLNQMKLNMNFNICYFEVNT